MHRGLDSTAAERDPGYVLAESRIGANVQVSDVDEAIAYCEGKLGLPLLERGEEQPYARFSGAGQTKLGVYKSATARPAHQNLRGWQKGVRVSRRPARAWAAGLARRPSSMASSPSTAVAASSIETPPPRTSEPAAPRASRSARRSGGARAPRPAARDSPERLMVF